MRLKFELNQAEFIIRVVDNNWKPGYICESDMKAIIYLTPSVLGFDNEIITKQLQAEVLIFPLQIIIHGIKVFMATLVNYEITNVVLGAWRAMMRYVGCTDITSYKKKESPLEFWTCADSTTDGALILYLYTKNLLNGIPYDPSKSEMVVKNQELQTDLGGTSVANLEPIRDNHKVKTIAGITKLFYFEWPIDGDYAGYIRAQCLPHIGSWSQFSPFEISKLTTTPINKPISNTTPHSAPKNPWIFSLSRVQNVNNQEKDNNQVRLLLAIEETFELKRGWALKTGNMNWTDRMTAKDMVEQLQILADEGEIDVEDVPEITTVASWITRYAASLKKQSAIEKAAEGSNTEMLIIFKKW
ncbi:11765_t:CDS:2 [Rhizophagus irregularis]|nr:11765_t:CDS:2 [Rhizophagus irregularis]